jgi:hypothetical protein
VLVPQTLNLPHDEQEKAIGRLTNKLLSQLPAESRKMYILQPRTFISEETFATAVLESMGISPEDMRQAQMSAEAVESLLRAASDEELEAALESAGIEPDYGFLMLVTHLAEQAAAAGDTERTTKLMTLRERLAGRSGAEVTVDQLIEALQQAHETGHLAEAVAQTRGVLDYTFFTALTQRIEETADDQQAERLSVLRSAILEAIDEFDATVKTEIESATQTLRFALSQDDPVAALRSSVKEPSGALFVVIDANLNAARSDGQVEVVEVLEQLRDAALEIFEESLPARQRLVNQLARTTDPREQRSLMEGVPELLDDELSALLAETAGAARTSGLEPMALALEQAAAIVAETRAQAGAGQ